MSYSSNQHYMKDIASRIAQVVEYLPSKGEALSSNPSTTKIKNKQQHYMEDIIPPFPVCMVLGLKCRQGVVHARQVLYQSHTPPPPNSTFPEQGNCETTRNLSKFHN
jgi:hypothetical protein